MIDMSKIKPYDRSVYYYETDRMQIVHHSNYIRWIEEARLDWMKQIGWDYKSIEDDGYIIPVLGVTAEYKSMCHFGDDVLIHVSLSEYTGVRVGFHMRSWTRRQASLEHFAQAHIVCWMATTSLCSSERHILSMISCLRSCLRITRNVRANKQSCCLVYK